MHPQARFWFDRPALFSALDERRMMRGLSWSQVAAETGVAAGTLKATALPGRMETDGMLAMVRWLGLPPESFIRTEGGKLPPSVVINEFRRFNTQALYAALNHERQKHGWTWQFLAHALQADVSAAMLTRLASGGRMGVDVMVACICWLGKPVYEFTYLP